MQQKTVGRFAPSPSGRMHLGNLFCALVAWLSVRKQGGRLLLRIEDLDPARCRPVYAAQLQDDLRWLGLDWDEGGIEDAACCQSSRTAHYEAALRRLTEAGAQLYPCFCSREELHAAAAPHQSDGIALYSGRCRRLRADERQVLAQKRRPALRIAVPPRDISFMDGHRGLVCQNLARECGDFILRRSDGVFAYQLAVVTDDALMGVTEVVRGGDLLDSTPRQLWLYELLGAPAPQFFHLPLLLGEPGRRLSKRDGDLDVGALRARFTPAELVGRLAFLAGLLPAPCAVEAAQLVQTFDWERIPAEDILTPRGLFETSHRS